jgi:hypothetical protein
MNMWDRQVEELAKAGFTVNFIAGVTNLTRSQVSYRTKVLKVSSMAYRRGESPEANERLKGINAALRSIQGLRRSITALYKTSRHHPDGTPRR